MIHKLVQILQQHKPVHFPQEHLWHTITCHQYIHTLQYLYHINPLMEQVTLYHHRIVNHCQQASHLQEILHHTTNHPKWYHTYQFNLIKTQFYWIVVLQTHLTHWTPGNLKNDGVCVINIIEKFVTMILLKIALILNPSCLKLHIITRLKGLKWMRILYNSGFISWLSLIHLKLVHHNVIRLVCCLRNIHP